MKKVALMFPGQGSQTVGMGQALYDGYEEVRQLYKVADDVLDMDMTHLMQKGPQDVLTETENAQPALLLSSIAAYTLLAKENVEPNMVVGHSLGEYSALVAARAMSLSDALPLVQTRGRLMEEAFPKGQGTMAAVLGLKEEEITETLKKVNEQEVVEIANLNCPGQIVISGSKTGIEEAVGLLKEAGAKRVLPLNVSGPFHSKLMQPANDEFQKHLDNVEIKDAAIPLYANVTAEETIKKDEVKELLIKQLYSPVQFESSIRNIIEAGVDAFVEVGTGKVLSGLVKKIDRSQKIFQVNDPASLEAFLTWYKE